MQKKVMVLSLGGSLIIPDDVEISFLEKFKKTIKKNTGKYKFIIVCGGGSVARKYIFALRTIGASEKLQSMAGISATRINARFMTYVFGKDANDGVPHDMKEVKNLLQKNDVVFCGALRYEEKQTSDSTSAKLANFFKTDFINMTNVPGLYTKNPLEKTSRHPSDCTKRCRPSVLRGESTREIKGFSRDAKFIPKISWKNFNRIVDKIKFEPGQHFVLDQTAAKIILKDKIKTYIIGKDLKQLDNILKGKKFVGTIIEG